MLSEVYDIEVLVNCFTYTGYCRQEDKYYQFVIWENINQYQELLDHLFRDELIMIGFNNDDYDYPIIHHLINHKEEYKNLSARELTHKIANKSNEIINRDFSSVADWNKHITQIDLYKIFHFNNKAKRTSLKDLEIALNLESVEDMPFDHTHWITNKSEVKDILAY